MAKLGKNESTVLLSRVLQHEIDIKRVLFIDRISPLKKQLLEKELKAISKKK